MWGHLTNTTDLWQEKQNLRGSGGGAPGKFFWVLGTFFSGKWLSHNTYLRKFAFFKSIRS